MRKNQLFSKELDKELASYTAPDFEVLEIASERGFTLSTEDVDQDDYEW